jgi:hypothetical protein
MSVSPKRSPCPHIFYLAQQISQFIIVLKLGSAVFIVVEYTVFTICKFKIMEGCVTALNIFPNMIFNRLLPLPHTLLSIIEPYYPEVYDVQV